jgi:penicillin-binding protein 1A
MGQATGRAPSDAGATLWEPSPADRRTLDVTTTDAPSRWERLTALPTWQRVTLLVLATGLVLALLGTAAAGLTYLQIQRSASIPSPDALEEPDPTVIRDKDGERLETFEPAELRRNIALEDLPDHVPDAVIAAEDRGFYEHSGYSPRAMARAAIANVTSGETVQGASTIHQQYVAMAVADIDGSYWGKFREAAIASRLDDEMAKDEVLEMYLNQVPYGRTAHGIEAAARTYFDVPAAELDLEQAAILAGIIAAPTAFDPERNPEGAMSRRDFVLEGMVATGSLERQEADELIGTELPELREDPLRTFGPDAYFLETVRKQVPELLEDDHVSVGEDLDIYTTLDTEAQQLALDTLNTHLGEIEPSGAISTIESDTGAVRALVGGLDFQEEQVNAAVDAQRQIGSAYKTFGLVELVDRGYDPDATRIDAPEEYDVEQEGAEDATIGNYSGRGHGEVSVREATVDSINTAYMQLAEELDIERIASTARAMGIETELDAFPVSILGTDDLRPLEVAAAYATLSAEGVHHQPHIVERIETHDGEVLYEYEADPQEVLDPNVAHVVTDVLEDVVTSGTASAAGIGRPVAGKTGTTNDYRDAWFIGYTPSHTTSVWVGNRDNSVMDRIAGGGQPSQIFSDFMSGYLEGTDVEEFPTPDTSELRALTGLEAPEPEEDDDETSDFEAPASEPDEEATEDEDDEADEDDDEADEDDDAENGEDENGDGDGNDDGNGNGDDGNDEGNGNGDDGNGEGNGNGDDGNDDGDDGGDDGDGDEASTTWDPDA